MKKSLDIRFQQISREAQELVWEYEILGWKLFWGKVRRVCRSNTEADVALMYAEDVLGMEVRW